MVLEGGGWLTPRPGRFTPRERDAVSIVWEAGWSGRVRKISPSPGFDPPTVQPVASHYTNYANLVPEMEVLFYSMPRNTRKSVGFGRFPDLAHLSFWEEQHVNEIYYGASCGMILTVEYLSTRRKAVPMPPCPLQILHGLTCDPVGALFRSSVVWVRFLPHREHRLRYENQSLSL